MLHRPRFAAHIRANVVRGQGVFLLSEAGHSVVTGPVFELVAPLMTGRFSVDQVVVKLRKQVTPAEVYYAVALLEEQGYLVESGRDAGSSEAAFWAVQGVDPATAARRLAGTRVSVTSLGSVLKRPFLDLLQSLGVRAGNAGDVGVVLADDYLRHQLQAYNREALRRQRPWLMVKPVGCALWIGPVFRPGETGCWECLAQRLRLNRSVELFVQRQLRAKPFPMPPVATPATTQLAYSMAATELANWIVRGETTLEGRLVSVDLLSWRTEVHVLVRQPQCPACGKMATRRAWRPEPLVLHSCKKTFVEDGGHRAIPPEETLARHEHHVSPITGVVHALHRRTVSSDGVIHAYTAGQNLAASHRNVQRLQRSLRSRSAGKGATDAQAKASALCEAIERYSGVFRGTEPRRRATLTDLAGLAIHPNECMRFSARQYETREQINARGSHFNYVPVPFDEDVAVDWSPVWSLTHQAHRYLPTEFCYFAYPSPDDRFFCVGCSNGNAAGNTREEAILQGVLELVERDSVALWWYNRARRPAVDVATFDEPFLVKCHSFLRSRHRAFWALDLTSDLGIPVFVALSRRTAHEEEHITMGFGAHLDPRIALLRAVTELNQSLAWLLSDADGEPLDGIDDVETLAWLKTATIANQPFLVPDNAQSPRHVGSYARQWSDDLRDDVVHCQRLVERRGMEMLVLDQTRADVGLPVVKVVVPGLRHFWARFAPGRLYDVPATLGWVSAPLAESQLNPIPMFL